MLNRLRVPVFVVVIAIGFIFLLVVFGMQVSSHPAFCGTCHVMQPYYNSWKSSSHDEVACVECHIPPGIGSEFRKKYEALAMVVRYITGTYGTNPWAEIEDLACLRCHERRLLTGKEVFKNVFFDHAPHLTEMRREKKLRCTSCHSQIVQGSHILVTEATCFLCHFKEQELGKGTSKCVLCHEVPDKIIQKAGFEFNHEDVIEFDMKCEFCHAHSVEGEGEVPRERCLTCHAEPRRLEMFEKTEFMHKIHVTEHKVECLNCHQEIYHGPPKEIEEVVKTPCNSCHLSGHSPQKDLYIGIGGKGVEPMPSVMYIAGIRCEGCHFVEEERNSSKFKMSGAISCMNCHGSNYYKIFENWKSSLNWRLRQTEIILRKAKKMLPDNDKNLKDALYNYNLVQEGYGIHNIDYSFALLDKAIALVNVSLREKKLRVIAKPWPEFKKEPGCLRCHQGIPTKAGSVFGRIFYHRTHIEIECVECHRPHKEKLEGELLRYARDGCIPCHHKETVKKECISCHKDVLKKEFSLELGKFSHSFHTEDIGLSCKDCHKRKIYVDFQFCEDCHG